MRFPSPASFQPLSLVTIIIIALVGCCMEIDISVPSFPSIQAFFETTEAQVQNTLSLNFIAFCCSGLLYGPLSESWGRRKLMLIGATLFLIGALGCAFAQSITQLMAWRFVQGLGASSTFVLGFVILSDRYQGDAAAQHISKINAYTTIFMALAPILGTVIISYFNWRANFSAVALIAALSWICLVLQLPETKSEKTPLNLKYIFKTYWQLTTHKQFLHYAMMPNLLVTAYLTFVGSASFFYLKTCGLSYAQFALHQGLIVITFSLVSFYAEKIISRIGSKQAVDFGMLISILGIAMFTWFAFKQPNNPIPMTASMCLFATGCAFPMSVTFAKSLEIFPEIKGFSSSFIMATRLLISSAGISTTGFFFNGSMQPTALVNLIALGLAAYLYYVKLSREPQSIQA